MLFEINNSSKRKTDLEKITQNKIYLTHQDIGKT